MRHLVSAIVLGSVVFTWPASAQRVESKQTTRYARLESAAQDLASSIRDAKLLLVGVSNRDLRKKLDALLSKAEDNLAVIQADLVSLNGNAKSLPMIDKKGFDELLASVKKQTFSPKKADYLVDYVKLSGPNARRLSAKQVKALLEEINFDKDRVPAAVALFEVTADRENFLGALDAFTFDNWRDKVLEQLELRK